MPSRSFNVSRLSLGYHSIGFSFYLLPIVLSIYSGHGHLKYLIIPFTSWLAFFLLPIIFLSDLSLLFPTHNWLIWSLFSIFLFHIYFCYSRKYTLVKYCFHLDGEVLSRCLPSQFGPSVDLLRKWAQPDLIIICTKNLYFPSIAFAIPVTAIGSLYLFQGYCIAYSVYIRMMSSGNLSCLRYSSSS